MRETQEHAQVNHMLPATIELGIGAWAWGDTMVWGYGKSYGDSDVRTAFQAARAAGVTFFDTAEIYGRGRSERLLGQFIHEESPGQRRPIVATKFAPYPWRLTKGQLIPALKHSLRRLDLAQVDLYQIHWTSPTLSVETLADALADAIEAGLTRAAGVSNYSADQTRRTHAELAKRGFPLAANQVEYSLIDRSIERDGTMAACNELGVRIIAYSPIGMGLLSGKYSPENPPSGTRRLQLRDKLPKIGPLVKLLKDIGEVHGKNPTQVAINWTICKGTLPIPGAKNASQSEQNAAAAGWRLTADEVAALDEASKEF